MRADLFEESDRTRQIIYANTMIKKQIYEDEAGRLFYRIIAVKLLLYGFSFSDVANIMMVTETTVRRWFKVLCDEGLNGLRDKSKPGRPKKVKLSDDAIATLESLKKPVIKPEATLDELLEEAFEKNDVTSECIRKDQEYLTKQVASDNQIKESESDINDIFGDPVPDQASDLERATNLNQSVSEEYEESLEEEFKEKQTKPDDEDDLAW